MELQTFKTRTEIPGAYTWDLSHIFAQDTDWERDFQAIQSSLPALEALQGTLAQSGQALLAVLQKRDEIYEVLERLYSYASLRKDEDTTNGTYLGMADRAMQLFVRTSTASSYIEPRFWPYRKKRSNASSTKHRRWIFTSSNWKN